METMTRAEAVYKILNTDGKVFGVKFIKRTSGELRNMSARLNVTKHLKGGKPAYIPATHDLLWVFDMNNGYRSIPIEGLREFSFGGKIYQVVD